MALEHEIKVPVAAFAGVRARLGEAGARLVHPVALEDNWVLDDVTRSVAAQGCLLRVRRWGDLACLTYKGPARFAGAVKTREELETALGDAEVCLEVLRALGYTPVRRYQKRREAWSLGAVVVALDETPMGCFVELEGDPALIPEVAATLGVDPAKAVPGTYLHLWETYRDTHPQAPVDMVF